MIRSGYRSIRIHGRRIAIAFWPKAGGPAAPTKATQLALAHHLDLLGIRPLSAPGHHAAERVGSGASRVLADGNHTRRPCLLQNQLWHRRPRQSDQWRFRPDHRLGLDSLPFSWPAVAGRPDRPALCPADRRCRLGPLLCLQQRGLAGCAVAEHVRPQGLLHGPGGRRGHGLHLPAFCGAHGRAGVALPRKRTRRSFLVSWRQPGPNLFSDNFAPTDAGHSGRNSPGL